MLFLAGLSNHTLVQPASLIKLYDGMIEHDSSLMFLVAPSFMQGYSSLKEAAGFEDFKSKLSIKIKGHTVHPSLQPFYGENPPFSLQRLWEQFEKLSK